MTLSTRTAGATLLSVLAGVILARQLNPEAFGQIALVYAAFSFINGVAVSGPTHYVLRVGADTLAPMTAVAVTVGTVTGAICALTLHAFNNPFAWTVAAYGCLVGFRLDGYARSAMNLSFARFGNALLFEAVCLFLVLPIVIVIDAPSVAITLSLLAAAVLPTLMLRPPSLSPVAKALLHVVASIRRVRDDMGQFLVDSLVQYGTLIIIGAVLGAAAAGDVRLGLLVASPSLLIVALAGPALMGAITRLEMHERRRAAPRFVWLLTLPPASYVVLAPPIVATLFVPVLGAQWETTLPIVYLCIVSLGLDAAAMAVRMVEQSTGAPRIAWRTRLGCWSLALAVGLPLAVAYGAVWIAAAMCLASAGWVVSMYRWAGSRGLPQAGVDFSMLALAASLATAAAWMCRALPTSADGLVGATVGATVFATTLAAVRHTYLRRDLRDVRALLRTFAAHRHQPASVEESPR